MTLTTVEEDDDCCGKDFWSCYGAREGRDESIMGRIHATNTTVNDGDGDGDGDKYYWIYSKVTSDGLKPFPVDK